jgi:hypothetical protein
MVRITAQNKMDHGYTYSLDAPTGRLPKDFHPLSPARMLQMGVFEGRYMTDCRGEFPASWFARARMVATGQPADPSLNYYKVKARQSLQTWQRNHWILAPDNRGWFQWYCRYYLGRRIPDLDRLQIARWKSFRARHLGQLRAHIAKGYKTDKERQALLQWGIDTRSILAE